MKIGRVKTLHFTRWHQVYVWPYSFSVIFISHFYRKGIQWNKKSTALRSSCKKIHSKGVVLNITLFFNSQLKELLKHACLCNSIDSQPKEPVSFQRLLRIKDISLCQIVLNGQQRDIWWLVRRIKFQIFEVKGLSIRCFCHSP